MGILPFLIPIIKSHEYWFIYFALLSDNFYLVLIIIFLLLMFPFIFILFDIKLIKNKTKIWIDKIHKEKTIKVNKKIFRLLNYGNIYGNIFIKIYILPLLYLLLIISIQSITSINLIQNYYSIDIGDFIEIQFFFFLFYFFILFCITPECSKIIIHYKYNRKYLFGKSIILIEKTVVKNKNCKDTITYYLTIFDKKIAFGSIFYIKDKKIIDKTSDHIIDLFIIVLTFIYSVIYIVLFLIVFYNRYEITFNWLILFINYNIIYFIIYLAIQIFWMFQLIEYRKFKKKNKLDWIYDVINELKELMN
ncbi:MAG: hypothetical protein ACTSPQ_21865 [Candidatus Helarchaeota archaeon]